MIGFLALVAMQAAPPPPPPDPQLAAPVIAFWNEQSITSVEREEQRELARVRFADDLLAQSVDNQLKRPGARSERKRALILWLRQIDPLTSPVQDHRADLCAAGGLVGSLSPEEIDDVRSFFRSPAGRHLWSSSGIGLKLLRECYLIEMRGIDPDTALRAVGVKTRSPWSGPAID